MESPDKLDDYCGREGLKISSPHMPPTRLSFGHQQSGETSGTGDHGPVVRRVKIWGWGQGLIFF